MSEQQNTVSDPDQQRSSSHKGCLGCLVIVFVTLLIVHLTYMISHNRNLERLDRSFDLTKHPYGTSLVRQHRKVGLLIGNSNHCDYFVGELRTYTGSKERISHFYEQRTVWNPISSQKQELEVAFIDQGLVSGYQNPDIEIPYPISDIAFLLQQKHDNKRYYVVYVLDAGYAPGTDTRCM